MDKSITSSAIASLFLTLVLFCWFCCSPALAEEGSQKALSTKNSRVTGSLYCVQGQITVKGWERELIARNPSLAKFHWSPITAARSGRIYFRQPISVDASPFRTRKPVLISLNETMAHIKKNKDRAKQEQVANDGAYSASTRQTSVSARLRSPASAGTATYASYSYGQYSPAPDYRAPDLSSNRTSRTQIYGRLISAK